MKRRKFFEKLGVGVAGLAAGSGASSGAGELRRNFGIPASVYEKYEEGEVRNRLRLSLARTDVPVEVWDEIVAVGDFWQTILSNQAARELFHKDRSSFLDQFGLSPELFRANDNEVQLMLTASRPDVLKAAAAGDYQGFMHALSEADLLGQPSRSSFSEKIADVLRTHRNEILDAAKSMEEQYHDADTFRNIRSTSDYMVLHDYLMQGKIVVMPGNLAAAVPVVVVVVALAVVVVGVLAIAAVGVLGLLVIGGAASVFVDGNEDARKLLRSRLSYLEPTLLEDAEAKIHVARLAGNDSFVKRAYVDLLSNEIDALYDAAIQVGLIKVDDDIREEFYSRSKSIVCKGVGLV